MKFIRLRRLLIPGMAAMLLLSACSSQKTPFPAVQPGMKSRVISVMPSESISARGNFDLKIIADSHHHDVRVIADELSAHVFVANVGKDNTLFLTSGITEGYVPAHRPTVIVRTSQLMNLGYDGQGDIEVIGLHNELKTVKINTIGHFALRGRSRITDLEVDGQGSGTIENVKSTNMRIAIAGKMHVDIRGVAGISSIKMSDNAYLNCYWVDSMNLNILARHHAQLHLGGLVDKVIANVYDSAVYDGRYLRAQDAFVKTYDQARADIQVVDKQHTYAQDRSNIYYFSTPEIGNDYMAQMGAVLDRVDIP